MRHETMGRVSGSLGSGVTRHFRTLAHPHSLQSPAPARHQKWEGHGSTHHLEQTLSRRKPTCEGAGGSSTTTSVQQTSASTTTTAGGIWAHRSRERLENGKEFLLKMPGFADEDDEGDVRQGWLEEGGVEEVEED